MKCFITLLVCCLPALASAAAVRPAHTFVIAIGVDHVDPAYYGNSQSLDSCERDARFYHDSLVPAGSDVTKSIFLNEGATFPHIDFAISAVAAAAQSGDRVIIGFSGHGQQDLDDNGDEARREPGDSFDEAWCLYDRPMTDDHLASLWLRFNPGVEIIVISDSCHSGTIPFTPALELALAEFGRQAGTLLPSAKLPANNAVADPPASQLPAGDPRAGNPFRFQIKELPATNRTQPPERASPSSTPEGSPTSMHASLFLFAACEQNQRAVAIAGQHSLFTSALKAAWQEGAFQGSLLDLHRAIGEQIPEPLRAVHTPRCLPLGPDAGKLAQKSPFAAGH